MLLHLLLLLHLTETVDFPSDKGFIKVNVGQTGFYRVNYDLSNWLNLIAHLHDNPQSQVHVVSCTLISFLTPASAVLL